MSYTLLIVAIATAFFSKTAETGLGWTYAEGKQT
jgi:hypothetical protein